MYYIANAVLLEKGCKVGDKISHKVAGNALIVFIRNNLKKELIEEYESLKEETLELISSKAITSFQRAKEFVFEMKKILT